MRSPLTETPESQLTAEPPSTTEHMLEPTKKMSYTQRGHNQDRIKSDMNRVETHKLENDYTEVLPQE